MTKKSNESWSLNRIYFLLIRLLFLLEGGVWSLNNVTISAPEAVLSGGDATLRCSYDLQGAALYSIRWYRAQIEFYRYVPREMPPTRVFPLPGATVDLGASDDKQVRLRGLHRQLSGDYQCEVSADAPLFHTEIKSAQLIVVDPPLAKPFLTVDRVSYTRGDVVRANCSVSPAYPPANISWYIDGKQIINTISSNEPAEPELWEAQSSFGALELTISEAETFRMGLSYTSALLGDRKQHYFHVQEVRSEQPGVPVTRHYLVAPSSGQLFLSCRSDVYDVYNDISDVLILKEDSPRPASVTGDDSLACAVSPDFSWVLLAIGSVAILRL